ncbi:MAG: insulinase family protein [Amphritea sp.]
MTRNKSNCHAAFDFLRSEKIESLDIDVQEYVHKKTGALHYHIAAENEENVFLVAFRTVPEDNKGVAHILEHTALCGSEKFPVRDPFFMMTRRSLNTFMNAFTSSDWTAYPFASQNRKDFFNLLDVYLDAAFFSRLDPLDFAQEGHRVEFEEPGNSDSPLVYKGVVFNEMKGAMSSPVSTLWQTLTKYLFPTTTYHFNSGGDPEAIPDLSYEELISFYKSHYHPSNAIFMTFGDIDVNELQERIESQALNRFERLDHEIVVEDEKRYFSPLKVEEAYALDQEDIAGKTHHVMGWLLGPSIDLEQQLKAHLLSRVLLDNSSSPLRYALESTDLGLSPSPLCGLEDSNREMGFMCGLEGSETEHAEAFEKLVMDTLESIVEEGVAQEHLEAALHQLELSQREISGDGYPYGMSLILASLSSAVHRGDPIALLNLDPVLDKLREDIKQPDYIQSMVKELLLNNPHRVRLTLRPDQQLSQRRDAAEASALEHIKAGLNDEQIEAVVDQAQALEARQNQEDDESVLPKVTIQDVPAEMRIPVGKMAQFKGLDYAFYGQGTNGLVYQQIVMELPDFNDQELALLPLYSNCMTELGCAGRDYQQTQSWQSQVSGGIHAYSSVRGSIDDEQVVSGYFILSGKALLNKQQELTQLLKDTLETVRFDELTRIRELVSEQRTHKEQSITGQGHSLAIMAACSQLSPAAQLSENQRGLSSIRAIKALDDALADASELQQLADQLGALHSKIVAAPRQYLVVAEPEHEKQLVATLCDQWLAADVPQFQPMSLPATRTAVKQAWTTSTQVNFCAKAYPTVPVEHPDAAPLTILGDFLRNGFLHRAIREQGGAYGSGAGQDSADAVFRFFSYRDPRLTETLADFDASLEWLQSNTHEPQKLEEAILGVVSSIDKPGSPAGEAKQAYHSELFGRTAAQRKAFRQRILSVTIDDLKRVAKTYLNADNVSIAVVTSPAAVENLSDDFEVIAI